MAVLPDEAAAPDANVRSPVDGGHAQHRAHSRLRSGLLGRPLLRDSLAVASFVAGAVWVMGHLVADPTGRVLAANVDDQAQVEWFLAHAVRVVTEGADPFHSPQMGVPMGVNIMDNTAVLGLSLPLVPVTLLFGVRVSFVVLSVLALSGTATSWFLLFARAMRLTRPAAYLGASLCGFGPAMVSHSNGHPNIVAQFLLPWLLWHLVALTRGAPLVRTSLIIAWLTIWQTFINQELLLITGVGFLLFGVGWLAQRPPGWRLAMRRLLTGLAIVTVVAVPLLTYPLYVEFFGAQHYNGLSPYTADFGADLASFTTLPSDSLGGVPAAVGHTAQNASEENSFLGIPLLLVAGVLVWEMRHRPAIPAMAGVAIVLALFSLGAHIKIHGRFTHVRGPFGLIDRLPLADMIVPTRLALALSPVVGIILALGCDRLFAVVRAVGSRPGGFPAVRVLGVLLAGALLALAPAPVRTVSGAPVPAVITSGHWRRYVPPGYSMVALPVVRSSRVEPLRWAALTGDDLALVGGYFLGPSADPAHPGDRRAVYSPPDRPTAALWQAAETSRQLLVIGPRQRTDARADLQYWRAAVIVLPPGPAAPVLSAMTTALLGRAPTWVEGAWLWDVRELR